MPHKKRPIDRDGHVLRDASLIVIASEDTYAVERYFLRFHVRRVQFKLLPTEEGRSSPEAVLARLDAYSNEYDIGEGDSLWLCIDTDHWVASSHVANLVRVLQECRQKDYRVAISKPCFELWLLLHYHDLPPALPPGVSCEEVQKMLRAGCGGYTKTSGPANTPTAAMVEDAMRRAKALDVEPANDLPDAPGTRVYRIIEALQQRDAIEFR